ncbi:replication protein A 70 kDa DNA-binding subunit B [Tanacetum coccineum]
MGDKEVTRPNLVAKVVIKVLGRLLGDVFVRSWWCLRASLVRNRLKELLEYDESQFKISLFIPQKLVVTIAEFFNGAVKKMVSSIHKCDQKSHCIVYARIHKIHKENRWAYTACKECNKKVNVVESKAMSSVGKSKVTFYCEDHV